MRIRTIKPEFWGSENVSHLARDARLVFIGLWSLADDAGRFRADPRYVAGQLLAYDQDGLDVVSRALASLRDGGFVVLYEVRGSHYGAITGWGEHQKIDRPSKSRLPEPPESPLANPREDSTKAREASCEEQGSGNREGNREQGAGKPSAAERPAGLARIEAPTTPTVGWSADEFWRWAQSGRGVQEKPPPPRTLSTWWTEARSVASVEALQRAFDEGFCSDPHWRRAAPPFPFAAFMSQWRKWVRPEAPAQAMPECVSCGQPARYGWPEVQLPMCQACMNDAVDFSHERSVLPWEGGAQQWLESRGAEGEVAHG